MSDAGPPVESSTATCPECGRSSADHLTMGEVYELAGYAKLKCARCLVSDVPRPKPARPSIAVELLSTTDARVWADEFCRIVGAKIPAIRDEREWMTAWFANAIAAGATAANRDRIRREIATLDAG